MVNEVTTIHSPQKSPLLIIAHCTLQIFYFNFQSFAFENIPSRVLAEVAGQRARQKIIEFRICEFYADEFLLLV
jgi:hypothetical protein